MLNKKQITLFIEIQTKFNLNICITWKLGKSNVHMSYIL